MRTLVSALILLALPLSATAQAPAPTESVTVTGSAYTIDLQGTRIMFPDEFYKFTGSYDLSNGKTLSLYNRGYKKFATLDGEVAHEIVATSSNSFVALDRQLKMKILIGAYGDVSGELYMVATPDHVAKGDTSERVVAFAFH